jgi:membrane protein required for colicin V production
VNGFDFILLVLLAVLVLLGLMKGLTRLLIGIGALIAAFLLAAQFHGRVATSLAWIGFSEAVLKLLAYLLIFVGTMLAGGLLAFLVRKLLKAAMLSWADRLAGAALGLVATALIGALLVLPLVAYSPFGERVLQTSVLAPYVTVVADVANELVPEELHERYREKVEDLRRYWRERWQAQPRSGPPQARVPSRVTAT